MGNVGRANSARLIPGMLCTPSALRRSPEPPELLGAPQGTTRAPWAPHGTTGAKCKRY